MIRTDVQEDTDPGSERIDGVELKTADFSHNNVGRFSPAGIIDQWVADIPAHKDIKPGIFHHMAQKPCCCCFAVGTGYGYNRFPDIS